jgi:hypothetical protein
VTAGVHTEYTVVLPELPQFRVGEAGLAPKEGTVKWVGFAVRDPTETGKSDEVPVALLVSVT